METLKNNSALSELLNDLVKINNDRIEGYKKAAEQVKDNVHLQTLFTEKALQSQKFVTELQSFLLEANGKQQFNTTLSGKIFRSWMDLKNSFKPNDKTSILDSCEFGENAAVRAYEEALTSDKLTNTDIHSKISQQYNIIKDSHREIKIKKEASEILDK